MSAVLHLSAFVLMIFVALLLQILTESQASPIPIFNGHHTINKFNQKYISRIERANVDVGKPQREVPANPVKTEEEKKTTIKTPVVDKNNNCSLPENQNSSQCIDSVAHNNEVGKSFLESMKDTDMLLRTLYVTLGVTGIVIVYFIVRAVRLRRRRTKSRKYGIITQQGDRGDLEMEPLGDGNEDEEDYTVFEVNGRKK